MLYHAIRNNEQVYTSFSVRDCQSWIRLSDKETWPEFVIVDSKGKPVEWQVTSPAQPGTRSDEY